MDYGMVSRDLEEIGRKHAFYRNLRDREIDLTRFEQSLASLTDEALEEACSAVPEAFKTSTISGIQDHLRRVRDEASDFSRSIREILA